MPSCWPTLIDCEKGAGSGELDPCHGSHIWLYLCRGGGRNLYSGPIKGTPSDLAVAGGCQGQCRHRRDLDRPSAWPSGRGIEAVLRRQGRGTADIRRAYLAARSRNEPLRTKPCGGTTASE